MRSPQDDLALVARCKRELPRKHEAFEELVALYQDRIYTLCFRLLGNVTEAQDALQEVLLRLFLGIKSFDGRSAFSTWLYRVIHNHCLNALVRRKRYAGRNEEIVEEPPDPRSIPRARAGKAQSALNRLTEEDRSLLVMKYVAELEIQEMAQVLDLGSSAVKMRLLRARDQFRKSYKEIP